MSDFWWHPIFQVLALLASASVIGVFAGLVWALLFVIAALLYLIVRHLRHMAILSDWLGAGDLAELPPANSDWDELFYGLERMVRRHKRGVARMVAVLDRFEHAAQAIPDGIVMINDADQIEWFNPVACQHFGLDQNNDRGQFIGYLLRQSTFHEYLERGDFREPLIMKSPATRDLTLSVRVVGFGERQKMLISRDVTQVELLEAMRRDFVANVSHELRTPLTVVGGFIETFMDADELPRSEFLRYCDMMQQQTERMRRLVEDLLTLSRLESPQNRLVESAVDMPMLVRALYQDALNLSAGRHPIDLVMDSDACVRGNADELSSALGNLVSNAVRYTPTGKAVHLRWGMKNNLITFSVQDEGDGIESHHIPRLTERFYRVDRGRSRETGGTGLGLAIAKHVLTRHQARLQIDSRIGHGSCFSAVFPDTRIVACEMVAEHTLS